MTLRIAIAKPDFGIRGGFEVVVDHVVDELEAAGHQVSWLVVDTSVRRSEVHGLPIPDAIWSQAPEYFHYVSLLEQFGRLDASSADVVLCTQPASWAVDHPRKLALFYHHFRVFYDLADHYARAGFVDPDLHARCTAEIRATEAGMFEGIRHFLVPSREVEQRLQRFNAVPPSRRSPFHAPGRGPTEPVAVEPDATGPVLCVSRHEWPKRTELAVAAAHRLATPGPVVLVGSGGRLDHVRAVDRQLAERGAECVDDESLWLPGAPLPGPADGRTSPAVQVLGRVSDDQLDALYRSAVCVVAPALLEDYGLTAIEAMAYGKPVITCTDGGGLADTVRDGENGLVVEPTSHAIAGAIDRLRGDGSLREQLASGALDTAATFTWARAAEHLHAGLAAATS